jgi:hypothetical protein
VVVLAVKSLLVALLFRVVLAVVEVTQQPLPMAVLVQRIQVVVVRVRFHLMTQLNTTVALVDQAL